RQQAQTGVIAQFLEIPSGRLDRENMGLKPLFFHGTDIGLTSLTGVGVNGGHVEKTGWLAAAAQVINHQTNGLKIVGSDKNFISIHMVVENHRRDISSELMNAVRGRAVPKRCDNRPRDAQGVKHLDGAQLTLGITMRAQDDGPITGLDAAGFDLAHDFGIERIDDMGDKDADIPGQLAVLIDGKKVRAVTVAGNRLFDSLTSRTPDAGRIIEIFRDRRPRDTAD